MSDPLSVAASVAGCLSLGIQAAQTLIDFYTAFRDRDARIDGTCRRLDNLLAIFQKLKGALDEREFSAADKSLIEKIELSVKSCETIIEELQQEAQKVGKSPGKGFKHNIVSAGRRVAYPFRESSLKKLDEDIRDIRQNISLALEVLHLTDSSRMRSDTEELKHLFELFTSSQLSKDLVDWLKAPDATINHNDAQAKVNPGSGLWLIDHPDFSAWLNHTNSFVWIYGFAGCGKSVLCSTIVQQALLHKQSNPNIGVAFFYFTFNDESKQNLSSMLRAFLFQLSNQLADGNSRLKELKDNCHGNSPSQVILAAALEDMIGRFKDTYLVIDALDEIPLTRDRNSVFQRLKILLENVSSCVHILVTSRDHPDIREQIEHLGMNISMKNKGVDKDVSDFISRQLQENPSLSRWSAYHERIEKSLIPRAQGVFRWVECQLDSLARCPRSKAALERRLASLPESLDETYERMLLEIDDDLAEDAKRIFTILCCATRPMTVAEVIDGLTVRFGDEPYVDLTFRLDDEDDIIQICPGFVDISYESDDWEDSEPKLRIAHFSVQEYLESDRIRQQRASRYGLNKSKAHDEMSIICLAYLLDPFFSTTELTDEMVDERPLVRYAATSWYTHYNQTQTISSMAKSLIKRLFLEKTRNFKVWAQIHIDNHRRILEIPLRGGDLDIVPSRIFYASLLGLEFMVPLLQVEERSQSIEQEIHIRELYGCPLQAASSNGYEEVVRLLIEKGADVNAKGGDHGSAIQAAASGGYTSLVQLLIDSGADVNINGGDRRSALHLAAEGGHRELAQLLVNRGAVANTMDSYGRTALQAASATGDKFLVQLLLDEGVDVNECSEVFDSALQEAASRGSESMVELLIKNGADVNIESGRYGTALQAAALGGFCRILKLLLDEGAQINNSIGLFGSALQAASYEGHIDVVQLLLDRGADVNNVSGDFGSAIQAAAQNGHLGLVELLINHGADVNICIETYHHDRNITALQGACFNGDKRIIHLLLNNGADVNAQSGVYGGALQAASFRGHEDVVELLLSRGAFVNAKGGLYGSALQAASFRGHKKVIQVLLDSGADINAIGEVQGGDLYRCDLEQYESSLQTAHCMDRKFGSVSEAISRRDDLVDDESVSAPGSFRESITKCCSALQLASLWGYTDLVRLLLKRGADVNVLSKGCGTALQMALFWDNKEVVDVLLQNGADINAGGGKLGSALHVASLRGHQMAVELLLDRGADVNAQSGDYGSALQAASTENRHEVAQNLLNQGADVNAHGGHYGSALVAAIFNGHETLAQLLLSQGADLNIPSSRYGSALVAALSKDSGITNRFVKLLIDNGAAVNAQAPEPFFGAIQAASNNGNLTGVKLLLDRGAFVDAGVGDSRTALQLACEGGYQELVQFLLDKGAAANAEGAEGYTALQAASKWNHLEIAKTLLDQAADINAIARDGSTALQAAASTTSVEMVKLLLERGADVNAAGGECGSALQVAAAVANRYVAESSYEIVQILLRRGADINARGGDFGSALQAAAACGRHDLVQLLLDEGADINATGGIFGSALRAARRMGDRKLVKLLVDRGA